ncbi:Pyridoxal phosphate homeostasis protein [Paenochrobactrum sp. BZR 201-1]
MFATSERPDQLAEMANVHDQKTLSQADIDRFGHDPKSSFVANLFNVQERMAAACLRSGRNIDDVRLLPVTKTVPANVLRLAYAAGIHDFSENKLQEARDKQAVLSDLAINWSIIGHLQTNKVKYLVRLASEFHALDSFRLAEELNRRLENMGRDLDVFVQVNTSGEQSKYGLHPDDLTAFVERLSDYPRLKPQGLMTLAIFSQDQERVRQCFRLLRRLRDEAIKVHSGLSQLSMGMSGDYEIAIEEGATVVRVGQAIFGARPTADAFYWPGFAPYNAEESSTNEN